MKVMFWGLSVCLKFIGGMGRVPRTKWLGFGGDTGHDPDQE